MPQPLTLCYVADATNIHVQRWLGFFVARGHRVYCLSDRGGAIEGATMIELPNRDKLLSEGRKISKTAVLRARAHKIRQCLREIKPDVMHAIFLYQRGWSAMMRSGRCRWKSSHRRQCSESSPEITTRLSIMARSR